MLLSDTMVLPEKMKDVYIRMECMTDLSTYLQQHILTEEELVRMMRSLCEGLEACEHEGIIHRDIKPENIFIDEEGRPGLGDFGSSVRDDEDVTLSVRGTMAYMAPEVYLGKACDHRVDIYSLGMVFYELMNDGRPPFADLKKQILSPRDKKEAFARRMAGERLPAPALASEGFGQVLIKTCAPDPGNRYQSAEELRQDLDLILQGKPPRITGRDRRMPGRMAAACLLVAILAVLFLWKAGGKADQIQVGADAYASLQEDGTLVISGRGNVRAVDEDMTKSEKARVSSARKILVKSGITSIDLSGIGYENGQHFPLTKEVVLPVGLERIADESFRDMPSLISISIPDSVTKIGRMVFCGCVRLESVRLPAGLKHLPVGCFQDCLSLKQITLPSGLESIGTEAFFGCSSLEEPAIPSTLSHIGIQAFAGTPFLKGMTKGDYAVVNGILLQYIGSDKNLRVPKELKLTGIAGRAFSGCEDMESIELPEGILWLGDGCFHDCPSLKKIAFPESLTRIDGGRAAFSDTPWYYERQRHGFIVINQHLRIVDP